MIRGMIEREAVSPWVGRNLLELSVFNLNPVMPDDSASGRADFETLNFRFEI